MDRTILLFYHLILLNCSCGVLEHGVSGSGYYLIRHYVSNVKLKVIIMLMFGAHLYPELSRLRGHGLSSYSVDSKHDFTHPFQGCLTCESFQNCFGPFHNSPVTIVDFGSYSTVRPP